jgi:hypothetical protein
MNNTEKIEAGIDHILAGEDALVPSSGFLDAVMQQVREEAARPQFTPFPWKRAVPGVALTVSVFAWGGYQLVHLARSTASLPAESVLSFQLSAATAQSLHAAVWVVGALAASLLTMVLSQRIAGRTGLL